MHVLAGVEYKQPNMWFSLLRLYYLQRLHVASPLTSPVVFVLISLLSFTDKADITRNCIPHFHTYTLTLRKHTQLSVQTWATVSSLCLGWYCYRLFHTFRLLDSMAMLDWQFRNMFFQSCWIFFRWWRSSSLFQSHRLETGPQEDGVSYKYGGFVNELRWNTSLSREEMFIVIRCS
jgi:hypothetical protein